MRLPFLKVILMGWVGLALAGCNLVYSETPLFTAADTAGTPPLRQGVWTASDDKCVFDQTRPSRRWPKCAGRMVIDRRGLDRAAWRDQPEMLLAAGDPLVLQFKDKPGDSGGSYQFVGARPTKTDARGRVIELAIWMVQCGPPPPPPPAADPRDAQPAPVTADSVTPDSKPTDSEIEIKPHRYVTLTPLPGLEIRDNDCLARDAEAVRRAAKASEAWSTSPTTLKWVRSARR